MKGLMSSICAFDQYVPVPISIYLQAASWVACASLPAASVLLLPPSDPVK
jgi:hypothetical protein